MAIALDWSESPAPNAKLRELVKEWFKANASDHPATATRQRQVARTFVEAVEVDGLDYEKLPKDFIAKHWFPKHGGAHRVTQNVLYSIVGKVLEYLRSQSIDVPVQDPPELALSPSKVKPPKPALELVPAAAPEAPVAPAAPPPPPAPRAKRAAPVPVPVHPNHPLPPLVEEPSMSPSAFAFPEPPANVEPRRGKPVNPVAALIPPENRLRIYRQGEPGQSDAHLLDMPSAMVARYGSGAGAIITILNDVIRPKWGPRPGERATYRFVQVNPQGVEGNATERDLLGENAPVMAMPGPVVAPVVPVPLGHDQFAAFQQLQGQLEQLQQMQTQRGPAPDPQFDANLHALQEQVEQLKAQIGGLATRPAGPGDFGTAALGAMTGMVDKMLANKPREPEKQPSFMEAFALAQQQADRQLAQQKQLFELVLQRDKPPAVDPGLLALMERMDARLTAIEEAAEEDDEPADDGLSGIKKFMETAEFLKKNMGIEAGPTMRSKEPENVLGLLRELMNQAPAIIAEYRQTIPVVAAARLGMLDEAAKMVGNEPKKLPAQQGQQQPAQQPTIEQQQAATRARLPPDVRAAVEQVLAATTDEQVGDAVSALVNLMTKHAGNNPAALNVFNTLEADVAAGNLENTVMRLRQIFVYFGYGAEAPVPKVTALAQTVIRLVKSLNERQPAPAAEPAPAPAPAAKPAPAEAAAAEPEAEPDEEEEGDEAEGDDEDVDEGDESDEDEDSEDEGADDEEGEEEEEAAAPAPQGAPKLVAVPSRELDPSDL